MVCTCTLCNTNTQRVWTHQHTYMYVCKHIRTYADTNTNIHLNTQHTRICTQIIHPHIYTLTHTYIHTYVRTYVRTIFCCLTVVITMIKKLKIQKVSRD